jgi:hypothetical protein
MGTGSGTGGNKDEKVELTTNRIDDSGRRAFSLRAPPNCLPAQLGPMAMSAPSVLPMRKSMRHRPTGLVSIANRGHLRLSEQFAAGPVSQWLGGSRT